jgi:hypothetical protein
MREHGSDYFENSRHSAFVQQEYAVCNPMEFLGYGKHRLPSGSNDILVQERRSSQ